MIERCVLLRVDRVWLMEVWADGKMSWDGSRGGDMSVGGDYVHGEKDEVRLD